MRRFTLAIAAAGLVAFGLAIPAGAGAESLVTNGSPASPFPQNKQNEPGVAIDPTPIRWWSRRARTTRSTSRPCDGSDCPFVQGIGNSGIYFSFDGGTTWTQPTYQGFSGRDGTPGPGDRSAPSRTTTRPAWSPTATRASRSGRGRTATAASRTRTARASITRTWRPTSRPWKDHHRSRDSRRSRSRMPMTSWRLPTTTLLRGAIRRSSASDVRARRRSRTSRRSGPTTPSRARTSATRTSAIRSSRASRQRPGADRLQPLDRRRRHAGRGRRR